MDEARTPATVSDRRMAVLPILGPGPLVRSPAGRAVHRRPFARRESAPTGSAATSNSSLRQVAL